ncbi:hypothetical protein WR25_03152 [Diploscapter pachys]|uniref:Gamma-glutamyltranspeptidase n=1 Tax=Diploscapter pachys TaxID=2018661 RepID=A0A2A2L6G1_9BILA|nr:hypothetical protein WR25_03152 [Diploscapter pachys]
MCGAPPPSSAAIAMAIISIVDGYDFDKTKDDDLELFFHRYIEASKFAYASRSWLGDPAFVANSTQIAMNITSKQWADWIRTRITDVTHDTDYYGGSFGPSDTHGTTNIAIIDADGNAVSVTSTINLFFGAKVASPSTGVVWNDEMDDFSLPGRSNYFDFPPSPANYIEPGKRMMSSMSPIIIRNTKDERLYAIGGAGGSEISTTVALVASQCLRLDRTIKEALDSPRLHNQLLPNCTHYEGEFPSQFLDRLRNRGHTFCREDYEAVDTGVFRGESGYVYANSDWRKGAESSPAGY